MAGRKNHREIVTVETQRKADRGDLGRGRERQKLLHSLAVDDEGRRVDRLEPHPDSQVHVPASGETKVIHRPVDPSLKRPESSIRMLEKLRFLMQRRSFSGLSTRDPICEPGPGAGGSRSVHDRCAICGRNSVRQRDTASSENNKTGNLGRNGPRNAARRGRGEDEVSMR